MLGRKWSALILTVMVAGAPLAVALAAPEELQRNAPNGPTPPKAFTIADVEQRAKSLASQPYAKDDGGLPDALKNLDYDQYREIRFKADKALWREEQLPFQVQMFHRGFMFRDRVLINVVDQGVSSPVAYSSELFDFGKNQFPGKFPNDLGYAGLRFHYPLRKDQTYDEVAVFLGASYFRTVGLGQSYGLSARGLALDTGLTKAEEFPVFREFWVEKPAKSADSLAIYALMDSPSATGAYKFVVRPGLDLVMEVSSHIFFRRSVERLGIAPLTSMFLHGENTDRFMDDFRPEVHDSDGFLMARSTGEWVWRPLNNPRQLKISVFQDARLSAFGLMQRDRNFDHYQDLEANYHQRPSGWVEAVGDWGPGAVYLIEIPSDAEKYDNIVAFWVPEKPVTAGEDRVFNYRLHSVSKEFMTPGGGKVVATRIGAGGADGLDSNRRRIVVDYQSEGLALLSEDAPVGADVSVSSGKVANTVVHKNTLDGTWRLSFELEPDPEKDPVELRAFLKIDQEILTETWLYQWSRK